jgi:uncharacterized protein (DUF362 family)
MNKDSHHPCQQKDQLSRRDFLKLAGAASAGIALGACASQTPEPTQVQSTASGIQPVPNPGGYVVAIGKASDYTRETIAKQVAQMIDHLGGLGDVVKSGDSVAIKVNLTGGVNSGKVPGYSAIESFITHPEVVRALIERVQAAGAKEIFIVESVYEWASYTEWGYEEIAAATGATLIDLNDTKPYDQFEEANVGENSFIYPKFIVNKLLLDVDVFMSVAKMKNHYNAGVTHSMKNLMGMVPARFYTLNPSDNYRSGIHGTPDQTRTRLPRAIVDENQARRINFSLIDGVKTAEAGEGPWIQTMTPIQPGVLVAGKNPVATDAVATAVMGFDPTANFPDAPFIRGDNHLNIAYTLGMGSNRLEDIKVLGAAIKDVQTQFTPAE